MHYIPLQERSSQRDRADELRLLTGLGSDEKDIDEKAVVDFKRIYRRHEVRALLWQKVGITVRADARSPVRSSSPEGECSSRAESKAVKHIHHLQKVGAEEHQSQPHCKVPAASRDERDLLEERVHLLANRAVFTALKPRGKR